MNRTPCASYTALGPIHESSLAKRLSGTTHRLQGMSKKCEQAKNHRAKPRSDWDKAERKRDFCSQRPSPLAQHWEQPTVFISHMDLETVWDCCQCCQPSPPAAPSRAHLFLPPPEGTVRSFVSLKMNIHSFVTHSGAGLANSSRLPFLSMTAIRRARNSVTAF